MSSRRAPKLINFVGSLVAVAFFAGCGSYSEWSGTPKDPFDPGPRPPSSGYGSGSGGMVDPGPMCEEARRRCAYEFVYKGMMGGPPTTGDERSVELRGDYRTGAWEMGDALTFDGKAWRVTVSVPWQGKSLYKFRIVDAMGKETWIADPENGINNVRSEINLAIWKAFQAEGISVPFPQRVVRVVNEAGADQATVNAAVAGA